MKRTALFLSLLALVALLAAIPASVSAQEAPAGETPAGGTWATESCTTHCHGAEATAYREDIHRTVLTCTSCHGGDPTAQRDKEKSHSKEAGFVGTPARREIPGLCGSCHADPKRMAFYGLSTDELALYKTSLHGKAVLEQGEERAAVCSDCHHAHGILPKDDRRAPTAAINQPATCGRCHLDSELMQSVGLPYDSISRFPTSVHGHVLLDEDARGAPSCVDCHGAHGAAPPGVHEVVQVCSQCHESTADAYRSSPHNKSSDMTCRACHTEEEQGEFDRTGCAVCHGAHAIDVPDESMYIGDEPGHCGHCHRDPGPAQDYARTILEGKRSLRETMERTRTEAEALKGRGLFLENEASFLRESQRALVTARVKAHTLDKGAMERHFEDGLRRQERTRELIEKKQRVLRDRLIVLGGVSFVLLLLLGLLGVKLAELRRLQ